MHPAFRRQPWKDVDIGCYFDSAFASEFASGYFRTYDCGTRRTMSTSFHGWRRKAGCALLVMACAFMGMWLRSFVVQDDIWIVAEDGTRYGLTSWEGGIEYHPQFGEAHDGVRLEVVRLSR
jgi:hypothetical protein